MPRLTRLIRRQTAVVERAAQATASRPSHLMQIGASTAIARQTTCLDSGRQARAPDYRSLVSSLLAARGTPRESSLFARPSILLPCTTGGLHSSMLGSIRTHVNGTAYQPSTRKRKRNYGFLARRRSRTGTKILIRRRAKGRMYLTH
ncbi:uncharacterized protein L969DRAFT_45452 [Mixia osmundae IAM 14324]|uniref:Large ribosomal subunit protein bL34m n=1 Tax=Mixia osmundae (strain CBS 9802 / IAM 14324 / JCM 22182 / KY 12970) TaxID=764103 RepID=G7DXS6_MIXOS|nr:uncharacterized protein L969DRAFT_45452 [Mixia osmundae IAM 14324]KEI41127.1 hypothetical protein L969DRAFT_45452 [Mixia osmundae IAM 14324]GAA95386.1 hypothetical protein E5Q_02040 [Mixia osmundae IAM 14324]